MCGVRSELRTNRVCTCVDMSTLHFIAFKPCFYTLDVIYLAILVIIECN